MFLETHKHNPDADFEEFERNVSEAMKKTRRTHAVCCWHMNEHESMAMWELYKNGHGIAIKSTIKRFKESVARTSKDVDIRKINYIDYSRDSISTGNLFERVFMKRNFLATRKNYA